MMKDQYANYVIQKMIDVAEGDQREMLIDRVGQHINALPKLVNGIKVGQRALRKLVAEGTAGRFRVRIENVNAEIPVDGRLQEH